MFFLQEPPFERRKRRMAKVKKMSMKLSWLFAAITLFCVYNFIALLSALNKYSSVVEQVENLAALRGLPKLDNKHILLWCCYIILHLLPSGLSTLQKIRKAPNTESLLILMTTASSAATYFFIPMLVFDSPMALLVLS